MVLDAVTCRCGTIMVAPLGKPDSTGAICVNCDVLQPQQANGKPRIPSLADKRANVVFARQVREWYPKQRGLNLGYDLRDAA